jgi:hypothetical protein
VRKFSRRTTIIAASLALVVVTSVVAYAWWSASGAGTGSASAAGGTAITVNQLSGASGLYPGGPASTLSGDFNNPNANPVYVNQVTATLTGVSGGAQDLNHPACTTSDFLLGGSAPVFASIPSGNHQWFWTGLTIELQETGQDQDNCKNAVVHISYSTS